MKQYKVTKTNNSTPDLGPIRIASVPKMYDNIRVIMNSEEEIFKEKYVSGLLSNNRLVKFKLSTLEFA